MRHPGLLIVVCGLGIAGCADSDELGQAIPVSPGRYDGVEANGGNTLPSLNPSTGMKGFVNESAAAREFGGQLRIQIPTDWVEVERTPIQRSVLLAKFKIPNTKIEIRISNTGGGVDGNFSRWRGQFTGGVSNEESVPYADRDARLLILNGDFNPGFGNPVEPDAMLLGVALSTSPDDYYIKLTGPRDEVVKVVDEFKATVRTASFFR